MMRCPVEYDSGGSCARSISAASRIGSRRRIRSMVSLYRSRMTTSSASRDATVTQSSRVRSSGGASATTSSTPMRSAPSSSGSHSVFPSPGQGLTMPYARPASVPSTASVERAGADPCGSGTSTRC